MPDEVIATALVMSASGSVAKYSPKHPRSTRRLRALSSPALAESTALNTNDAHAAPTTCSYTSVESLTTIIEMDNWAESAVAESDRQVTVVRFETIVSITVG